MDKIIKEALERAAQQGAEMENLRIRNLITEKGIKTDNYDICVALMELFKEEVQFSFRTAK
jgi:multimeric flavodoxin WrbA